MMREKVSVQANMNSESFKLVTRAPGATITRAPATWAPTKFEIFAIKSDRRVIATQSFEEIGTNQRDRSRDEENIMHSPARKNPRKTANRNNKNIR